VKHQSFVGAGYFDEVNKTITGGKTSITALEGSTEEEQFHENDKPDVKIHNIEKKKDTKEQSLPNLKQRKFNAG
jgi:hypothetical protein